MYSIENVVNNIVTTLVTDDTQIYSFVMYINVKSLFCTLETNTILYVNFNFKNLKC